LESLDEEFQFFLSSYPNCHYVDKKNRTTTNVIQKDVEVDIITKKVKNIVHIVFEMKKEIEELEVRIMQNRENLNGIPKLVPEYPIKLSKYL
jgi:hypothetical protein